jgi:unsaturated chondroitin disaccharide hydrolase
MRDEPLELFEDAMAMIVDGTRYHVRHLMDGYDGYVSHFNNWTGRYARSEAYAPHDTGFLLGRLWVCFAHSQDEEFRKLALKILKPVIPHLIEEPIVSLVSGSEVFFGLCMGAEFTGSEELHDLALRASCNLVANLWSERSQRILPWVDYDEAEVPLEWGGLLYHLLWTGHAEPRHVDLFVRHQETVLAAQLVRAEGSTRQVAQLDETGWPERFETMQGWCDESTWTRGQAWAMHNFIAAAQVTGRADLAEIAHRLVGWWLDRIPADWVPYYDFDDPERELLPRDSCAAALSLTALQSYAAAPEVRSTVSAVIDGVLAELCRNYLSVGGLLLHSSIGRVVKLYGRTPDRAPPGFRKGGVPSRFPQEDIMPYGNYFIVEALHRRLRGDGHFPVHLVKSRFA